MTKLEKEQALQLLQATWDGDLISKAARSALVERGLATRGGNGFNILTASGLDALASSGDLHP